MDYAETLAYLYDALPMYQRIGPSAYKSDLINTLTLCEALGNPQSKFKSVHVAGTNGKGSSSHMIAAVLQSAGYKTGLYTSPHLKEFTERIRIQGLEVEHDFVIDFVTRMKPLIERIHPSFFEITVAMAFDYFARQRVDIAVIEVGLGGRLDSTNVIVPMVSLITNIGYDHMNLLGNELPEIAFEKAGIIKRSVPVVVSERQEEVEEVFIRRALQAKAPIFFATDQIDVKERKEPSSYDIRFDDRLLFEDLTCQLKGRYQMKNLAGVLGTLLQLKKSGFSIPEEAVRAGIGGVVTLTGLKGRWQTLGEKPLVICDTGHNVEGVVEIVRQIRDLPYRKLYLVLGVVKDKDARSVLKVFPKESTCYFCQANIPRALPASELAEIAEEIGLTGEVVPDVNDALARARAEASADDLIFVGGSTFVVAELDEL